MGGGEGEREGEGEGEVEGEGGYRVPQPTMSIEEGTQVDIPLQSIHHRYCIVFQENS